jgi:8-oxo-dGTP diphosphatase
MSQSGSSQTPPPRLRYGASIAVLKHDAVLLVKRGQPPFMGLWSLPGGSIQCHETPREAVLRELKEETGVEAEVTGILDIVKISTEEDSGHTARYRLTVLYGRYLSGVVRAGSDAEAAKWVDLDDLGALPLTTGTAALIHVAAGRLQVPGG